jgi:hypothetical protein
MSDQTNDILAGKVESALQVDDDANSSTESSEVETPEEQVDLITEGYFTINDVMFEWGKVLDPWEVSSSRSLVGGNGEDVAIRSKSASRQVQRPKARFQV